MPLYGEEQDITKLPQTIKLPEPRLRGAVSVEEALSKRRSIRSYKDQSLTLWEVSQLLWAAQGVTDRDDGLRTAPSAGALYPLEVYLVVGRVDSLAKGVYRYRPSEHLLEKFMQRDVQPELSHAALDQSEVASSAIVLVISGVYQRTAKKYGERAALYVPMEAGHAAQNVYLQAQALNLGTVVIGAFHDDQVKNIFNMKGTEEPLYLMPVGRI